MIEVARFTAPPLQPDTQNFLEHLQAVNFLPTASGCKEFLQLLAFPFYTTARNQSRFRLDQTYEGLAVEPKSFVG
jgi:hypothetical protein